MAGPSYSPGPGFGEFVNKLANPPNPMQQLQQTVEGLNALKSYQANQASADAYRQSVDPNTGEVDLGKYKSLMSQGPGSWLFGPQTQQAGQAVGAVGQGTSANVKANLDQLSAAGTLMLPLYKQAIATNYVNPADAQAALDQAYQMKLVTPQQYEAYTSTLKSSQNAAGFVIGANTGIEAARTLALGRPGTIDVGGTVQPVQPVPGALPSAAPPMQKTLAPGEAVHTTMVPIGGGHTAPVPDWVTSQGGEAIRQWLEATKPPGYTPGSFNPSTYQPTPPQGGPTVPPPAPGGGGGGGGQQPPVQPGRYPRPVAPAPAPAGPDYAQPPPPNPDAGGPGVSPATGYEKTVDASRGAEADLQGQIRVGAQIKPTLREMESDINRGATSGVGTGVLSGLRQTLINAGLTPDTSAGEPNVASAEAAQNEFKKNAARLQTFQLSAMGNPTDARQELISAAQPGEGPSVEGNRNIIHMLEGNQQGLEVVGKAWSQAKAAGWGPDRFNEWANEHFYTHTDKGTGGKFDLRVFTMANAPTLAEQQTYYKNVPDQAQFKKDVNYAGSQGWLTRQGDGPYQPASP